MGLVVVGPSGAAVVSNTPSLSLAVILIAIPVTIIIWLGWRIQLRVSAAEPGAQGWRRMVLRAAIKTAMISTPASAIAGAIFMLVDSSQRTVYDRVCGRFQLKVHALTIVCCWSAHRNPRRIS